MSACSAPRSLALGLLAGAVSLAVFLLLAEGALQVYHRFKLAWARWNLPPVAERALVPSDDPELLFEFNPGWSKEEFSINSSGMAEREVAQEKPPAVFRIAFVGDSLSANFGHRPRDEIYLKVLERRLNQRALGGFRFETLNFGVNAYSILQSLRMAQTRVPRFDPDLLVAQLCLNDPYPSDTEYANLAPMNRLRVWNFVWRRVQPARFWGYMFVDRHYDARGWGNVRRGLAGFAKLSRSGLPVEAVLFPYLHAPAYEAWGYREIHARYAEEAERVGLPLLDLLETFERAGLIDGRWPRDPLHPDTRGHELAAEAILTELEARGLLPGAG